MAAADADTTLRGNNLIDRGMMVHDDPFLESDQTAQPYPHRFSSRYEHDNNDLGATSSPSQVKRVLEAHLLETERRLQDAQKLGTSLLQQQSELQEKLHEVDQQRDEAEIPSELRQRLASLGREHDDVSREIARSLLAPKSRVVSGDENLSAEPTTLTSQATGSPTKISAPSRRQRNQPTNRAGDLQFAADISTSLLAQVRQLQAAVAERDDSIKSANAERLKLEQDVQIFTQKLRSHDENEQRYKDENWNLEAQNHELLASQREAIDKEKRLNATLAIANAEKRRLLSDIEEAKLAHSKISEEHTSSKKAHEAELHSLKRDFDLADSEKSTLQSKIDELTAQNQELAKAAAIRFRNQSPQRQHDLGEFDDDLSKDLSTPEHSPPPSPTKATPRHGGLESETLKSSLHHAHRMIQNLKGNIHREKTEKIELKRMLQEARDELEQQRKGDNGLNGGSKKQKTRNEPFKKPLRPDMLGSNRRARTDVELQDDEWEDQSADRPTGSEAGRLLPAAFVTDASDAYQTAHETESNFETADERQTTESEAFETGAESLAGDSTDDLTETESTAPRGQQKSSTRHSRPSLAFRNAGNRNSYLSTASTSGGEDEGDLQTPMQSQPNKFRLRNGKSPFSRQTQIYEGTPDSVRSVGTSQDSPATVLNSRSPPAAEQSLFAELQDINDTSSSFSTPARSGTTHTQSAPGISDTPSKSFVASPPVPSMPRPIMVDMATMTEPWQSELDAKRLTVLPSTSYSNTETMTDAPVDTSDVGGSRVPSIGDFPLPPSVPSSPANLVVDSGTQYTPRKPLQPSIDSMAQAPPEPIMQHTPSRKELIDSPTRGGPPFITPPRTVWDEDLDSEARSPDRNAQPASQAPKHSLAYSEMLMMSTVPLSPPPPPAEAKIPTSLSYSSITTLQSRPIAAPPSLPPTAPLPAVPSGAKQGRPSTSEKAPVGAASGGILAGAAAALGLPWSKDSTSSSVEGEISDPALATKADKRDVLHEVPANAVLRNKRSTPDADLKQGAPIKLSSNDQSSQTMLTSEQIEEALLTKQRDLSMPPITSAENEATPALPPLRSLQRSQDHEALTVAGLAAPSSPPPPRPSSSSSHRSSSLINRQHPPLPSDYKTNIARANSMIQQNSPNRESGPQPTTTVMGPPLMPASAMRRPKTPSDSVRGPSRENATPRVGHSVSNQRSAAASSMSRRSSVSSFASELDERFNIRTDARGNSYAAAPGTDPRMIQAITQTMIGEYLWKYTRKTVSKDMSSTRHRRYFWVHPYTKTLYWSNTDPSAPGSKEVKSRSVPIESIRVVSDENPMPPGLHRKSLEITAPGRKVKITAQTGQRHETWFNALSYLLLRGEPADTQGAYATGGQEITRDDINEFRVGGYDPHLVPNTNTSRVSMSSYNSRTTAGTSKRVSGATSTGQRQSLPSNVVSNANGQSRSQDPTIRNSSRPTTSNSNRVSRADQPGETDHDRTVRASSLSRVSKMFSGKGGRSSRQGVPETVEEQETGRARGVSMGESSSIYNASVVSATRDSAEEARQEMLRQEAMGLGTNEGLENVRACCDGKHDVSTLSHNHRHSDRHRALSSMSERINRSMSKRV